MTRHHTSFMEFEAAAQNDPPHTQYFVEKAVGGELWVRVLLPQPSLTAAEAIASLALGDPTMMCKVTGSTEFGTTGTVVPRLHSSFRECPNCSSANYAHDDKCAFCNHDL